MITDAQRQEAGRLARDLSYLSKMMTQVQVSYGRQGAWMTVGEIE